MSRPTIIVVHPSEKRSKCSVEPLRGQPGFVFWNYPKRGTESLDGYVRLGIGGPQLTVDDCDQGLVLLDGSWRWAAEMEKDYQDLPVRSLAAWETAYPRRSKLFVDPVEGLATIEALYAAHCQMGRYVEELLSSYYWRDVFLKKNGELRERFIRRSVSESR
jgi:pre-rRNA-processing protein TSR3